MLVDFKGIASTHLVVRSMTVNRWVKPWDSGKGPTRSTWMWENRLSGMMMCSGRTWTCLITFEHWQSRQLRAHAVAVLARLAQTYLAAMRRFVARRPGWAALWTWSNTCFCRFSGTNGRN